MWVCVCVRARISLSLSLSLSVKLLIASAEFERAVVLVVLADESTAGSTDCDGVQGGVDGTTPSTYHSVRPGWHPAGTTLARRGDAGRQWEQVVLMP